MPRWMLKSDHEGNLVPGSDLLEHRFLTRGQAYDAVLSWARDMDIDEGAYTVEYEDGRQMVVIPRGTLTVYPDGLYWRIEAGGHFRPLSDRELWMAGKAAYPRPEGDVLDKLYPTRTQAVRAVTEWASRHGLSDDLSVVGNNGRSRFYLLNGWFELRETDDGYRAVFIDNNTIDYAALPVLGSVS